MSTTLSDSPNFQVSRFSLGRGNGHAYQVCLPHDDTQVSDLDMINFVANCLALLAEKGRVVVNGGRLTFGSPGSVLMVDDKIIIEVL